MPSVNLSPETLARLEAQLQADLDAVRRVRALLKTPKDAEPPVPAVLPPAAQTAPAAHLFPDLHSLPAPEAAPAAPPPVPYVPPPSTEEAVTKAVALLDGTFGPRELKAVMAREHLGGHPNTEIRAVLNRMVKTGELRVVEVNRGRGGSTYQRVLKG